MMLTSNLKRHKRSKKQICESWVSFVYPSVTQIFTYYKFDFITIDIKLRTINLEQTQYISASQYFKVSGLPRPISHSNNWTKPRLEFSAAGLNSLKFLDNSAKSQPSLGRLPTINKIAEHRLFPILKEANGVTGQSINIEFGV